MDDESEKTKAWSCFLPGKVKEERNAIIAELSSCWSANQGERQEIHLSSLAFKKFSLEVEEVESAIKILKKLHSAPSSSGNVTGDGCDVRVVKESAFGTEFIGYDGVDAFWNHLDQEMKTYQAQKSRKYPFFTILQSSGYGKSRLVTMLAENNHDTMRSRDIVYLSFAGSSAFPKANVVFAAGLTEKTRDVREAAFFGLFKAVSRDPSKFAFPSKGTFSIGAVSSEQSESEASNTGKDTARGIVFFLDEVAQLAKEIPNDMVSMYRCLRRATAQFASTRNAFFVFLSTYSSAHRLIPGKHEDASNKDLLDIEEGREPMASFLLHQALGLRNDQQAILRMSINDCHQWDNLMSMGRPLWKAYIDTGKANEDAIRRFAASKLLSNGSSKPEDLSQERVIAILACRVCLTISPVSQMASALVASHMATAVSISRDREQVVVAYPSEPILALAARDLMNEPQYFCRCLSFLATSLQSGAVSKGHRGEVVVGLLLLRAMDHCMRGAHAEEVSLRSFLSVFSRPGAEVSFDPTHEQGPSDKQLCWLKRQGIYDGPIPIPADQRQRPEYRHFFEKEFELKDNMLDGTVSFTHFVYLSEEDGNDPLITPDLLRMAYRRTAALVVDAGRRGIDKIIPVRTGEDTFVGLAVQDKNRMNDTLAALEETTEDATHVKVSARYFLSRAEQNEFTARGWSLEWPSVLFSVDANEVGFGFAKTATRRRLRADKTEGQGPLLYDFPCLIFTGMNYCDSQFGLSPDENRALEGLRKFVQKPPESYKRYVPLVYGAGNLGDDMSQASAMDLDTPDES